VGFGTDGRGKRMMEAPTKAFLVEGKIQKKETDTKEKDCGRYGNSRK
jgi:hypothetical protein